MRLPLNAEFPEQVIYHYRFIYSGGNRGIALSPSSKEKKAKFFTIIKTYIVVNKISILKKC